jgi:hypothetical protein
VWLQEPCCNAKATPTLAVLLHAQDNCPVALAAAHARGLSAALFAPGWVWEEFDRSTFEPRQEAFWDAVRRQRARCNPPAALHTPTLPTRLGQPA